MGSVSVANMAAAVTAHSLRSSDCYDRYKEHPADFMKLLIEVPQTMHEEVVDRRAPLLDRLVVDLPAPLERQRSMELIGECVSWFIALQSRHSREHGQRSLDLLKLSRYPERTQRYLAKSSITAGDFTNIGGIDIELCHIVGFYPEFWIVADSTEGKNKRILKDYP